jgi:rhodanese-related sulfurtransferase
MLMVIVGGSLFLQPVIAGEVDKGGISADHLAGGYKLLDWGSPVWDVPEALACLNAKEKVLWVDTRPESICSKGTVLDAVVIQYNKSGAEGNDLTKDKLIAAIQKAGLAVDSTKIIFYCQGPECHRSYNASFVAVTQWGFKPENMIWFRDGYPVLFKEIKADPKLKRKASQYLSASGVAELNQ